MREHSARIKLHEFRAIYRLIGECWERGKDPLAWRQHMLAGLARLSGAQVVLDMQITDLRGADEQLRHALDHGFTDTTQRDGWLRYQQDYASRSDPYLQSYFEQFSRPLMTRRLEEVIPVPLWQHSHHYRDYFAAANLGDRITSVLQLPGGAASSVQLIELFRHRDEQPFAQHTAHLIWLFHHELSVLLGRQLALPETQPLTLPPRLQQILDHLHRGASEKQIARALGISHYTVNHHVQRLYRLFGVHTRSELLCHCQHQGYRPAPDNLGSL